MRILLLSFYFEPDLSAGSFRATRLAHTLARRLEGRGEVCVYTTQPNRYRSFRTLPSTAPSGVNLSIMRVPLPEHRSGFVDQSIAFLTYAHRVLRGIGSQRFDVVFATSSRLMTAALGSVVARRIHAPLYLDIRDIFVDTLTDVLKRAPARALIPLFASVERRTIARAQRVNLVSEGFRDYFASRYPDTELSFIPNGIDDEFREFHFDKTSPVQETRVVLYAGNIGEGQGLHRIIPTLARALRATHEFWIVGDGGARHLLEAAVSALPNVKVFAPVARQELLLRYKQADVLFVHLNDYPAFQKVLPSKLFEYVATGKPVLAGVAGYAARFLQGIENVKVFAPCDVAGALQQLSELRLGLMKRTDFCERYRRDRLTSALADDVMAVAEGKVP